MVKTWCVLYILTHKCASRHSGVQKSVISHLTRCLRTRHFREPTFRPSRPTNHWKNTTIRDFPSSWRYCIFFLLILLSSDSAYLLCFPDSTSLLCFSSLHIVGSLTSKLPSIKEQLAYSYSKIPKLFSQIKKIHYLGT